MNKRQQNKIKTPGYFIKRLRDCKYSVLRVFQNYGIHDFRRWTVLVDPGNTSIFVTCYNNKDFSNEVMFEFNDGGNFFPKNFSIKTESIEIIVQILVDKGIPTMSEDSPYFKPKLQKHGQPA
jgi:hypothetical protein